MKKSALLLLVCVLVFVCTISGCNVAPPYIPPANSSGIDDTVDTPVAPDDNDDDKTGDETPGDNDDENKPDTPPIDPNDPNSGEENNPPNQDPSKDPDEQDPKPPVGPDEPTPDIPPTPSQAKLPAPLTSTMWKTSNKRYRFNESGSVDLFTIDEDFSVKEEEADFKWKYEGELLYFYNNEESELADISIESETETLSSEKFAFSLIRSDTVFKELTVVKSRTERSKVMLAYENGAFVFASDYKFFTDEAALHEDETANAAFAYPSNISKLTIHFESDAYSDIVLHSYVSAQYIFENHISLPTITDENFECWKAGEEEFANIYEVVDHMCSNSVGEITLNAAFTEIIRDKIEGTYYYENSAGETFEFVIDSASVKMYSSDGDLIAQYIWKTDSTNENKYYLYKDISDMDSGTSRHYLLYEDGEITVSCQDINTLMGLSKFSKFVLTSKKEES